MKSFRKACRGQKGFTLIELLVVIIILGVLGGGGDPGGDEVHRQGHSCRNRPTLRNP